MNRIIPAAAAAAFLFVGAAYAQKKTVEPKKDNKPAATTLVETKAPLRASTVLKMADGKKLGTVNLEQLAHGVLVSGELTDVPAGGHAMHFHEVGKCEPPFVSAQGHFNPGKKKHGLKAAEGAHAGDLPNLFPENGKVKFEVVAHDISLREGEPGYLIDADGTALVLHATLDDYVSDPAGNAGSRMACGTIRVELPSAQ